MTNTFHNYYKNKIQELLESVEIVVVNRMECLKNRIRKWIGEREYTRKLTLKEITPEELDKYVKKLSNSNGEIIFLVTFL